MPNNELMKLSSNEDERWLYFIKAVEAYKAGISYWNCINPSPTGEIMLFNNLLGGLLTDFITRIQDLKQRKI
jgi:hypothetical protein